MYISNLEIKNYRSIHSVNIECKKLSVFCGSNSVGKSNLFRAIEFSFQKNIAEEDVLSNITLSKRASRVQIHINIIFENCPKPIREIANTPKGTSIEYSFRATKKGRITRKLNGHTLSSEEELELFNNFSVVYIPTIRDLTANGIDPFQQLFKKSIYSGSSGKSIKEHIRGIKKQLSDKAQSILSDQKDVVQNILGAKSFNINTDNVIIDDAYNSIELALRTANNDLVSMSDVGTGYQSVAIISLYRQLGATTPGHTLYLFEEPDSHLHPPTIRAIGEELIKASEKSQVLVTTHSPVLVSYLGLHNTYYLSHDELEGSSISQSEFSSDEQVDISRLLSFYGLRLTEALFSKAVVLVEGPSDVAVISRVIELTIKRNIDQLDVLIVPAGGKGSMPDLIKALNKLGIRWFAILDYDAVLNTHSIPITLEDDSIDKEKVLSQIDYLTGLVDVSKKRGAKVVKYLAHLNTEIKNGRPEKSLYGGSVIQDILENHTNISKTKIERLFTALRNCKKTDYRKILQEFGIFLFDTDLERIITKKDKNLPVIERVLRSEGLVHHSVKSCNKEFLRRKLHKIGYNSKIWIKLVDQLNNNSGFARTEINLYVKNLVEAL